MTGTTVLPSNDGHPVAVQRIDGSVWIAVGDTTTILTVGEARQLAAAITRAMDAE